MEETEKIKLAEKNIRQAIADYFKHTNDPDILNDVSNEFIERLARDNYYAKQELRELFRKSPVWDENLDSIVINGSRTHNPDYKRIKTLIHELFIYVYANAGQMSDGSTFQTRLPFLQILILTVNIKNILLNR